MKKLFLVLKPLLLLLFVTTAGMALANDPAPAKPAADAHGAPPKKEEKKDDHGAAPKKDEHGAPAKDAHGAPAKEDRPKRTFEGQEPLFYFDSKRRPYIEPFHKTDEEEYYTIDCISKSGICCRSSLHSIAHQHHC
jgi:hypothetical protein